MEVADHTAHYNLDAEQFDYFETGSGPDFDAAKRIQDAVLKQIHRSDRCRLGNEALILDIGSGNGWVHQRMSGDRRVSGNRRMPGDRRVSDDRRMSGNRRVSGDGLTVVSVDIGIANLKTLRQKDGADSLLVAADAGYLPFRNDSFDGIVCSEVLEHLNDPASVLAETHRVTKPEGMFVASTPYREVLRYYLCIHCNRRTPANAHLHSFDEAKLMELLRDAGYVGIRFSRIQNKLFIVSRLSCVLRFLPYSLWSVIDQICSFVYRKMNTIVISGIKQ